MAESSLRELKVRADRRLALMERPAPVISSAPQMMFTLRGMRGWAYWGAFLFVLGISIFFGPAADPGAAVFWTLVGLVLLSVSYFRARARQGMLRRQVLSDAQRAEREQALAVERADRLVRALRASDRARTFEEIASYLRWQPDVVAHALFHAVEVRHLLLEDFDMATGHYVYRHVHALPDHRSDLARFEEELRQHAPEPRTHRGVEQGAERFKRVWPPPAEQSGISTGPKTDVERSQEAASAAEEHPFSFDRDDF